MNLSRMPTRGRLIGLIGAGLVLLVVAGFGVYGLIAGPHRAAPREEPGPEPALAATTATAAGKSPLPDIGPSSDPETFARQVATALFAWDTGSGLMPLDYTRAVLAAGDPTGPDQPGLAADVAAYLPTRQAWTELRKYATVQHLSIDNAFTPAAWAAAVAQARPGQLPAGASAVTIEGTRQRAGLWNGEAVTSEHAVSFTVFVACPPVAPGSGASSCHVLRLSQLDKPLR